MRNTLAEHSVWGSLGGGFEHLFDERGACYVSPSLGRCAALSAAGSVSLQTGLPVEQGCALLFGAIQVVVQHVVLLFSCEHRHAEYLHAVGAMLL